MADINVIVGVKPTGNLVKIVDIVEDGDLHGALELATMIPVAEIYVNYKLNSLLYLEHGEDGLQAKVEKV